MFQTLMSTLLAGLTLWNNKESTKYRDKVIQLKKDYYEEYNKDLSVRSDAVLDNIRHELCIISESFAANAGIPSAPDQPGSGGA